MASITYWNRLEPRPVAPSIAETLAARLRDPLWLLTRQWQFGEFQGEDAGSPAYVHIHAVGKCEAPFESAGGHFNPGHTHHGMMSGEGHAGDMPNLHVPQDGSLSVEVLNREVTLEQGKPNSLFDNDGSSLVIHAKADDYKSDPAGNAGDRIACGVINASGTGPATVGSPPAPNTPAQRFRGESSPK